MSDTKNNEKLEDVTGVDSPNDDGLEANAGDLPPMNEDAMKQVEEMMQRLSRVDDLEREVAEWKTKYLRMSSDFDNYRNRTQVDVADAKNVGAAEAIETMLGTYDDLSRAVDAGVKDPSSLIPGLQSVRENFLKNLERYGAQMVPGAGAAFDPNVHEALQVVPGPQDDVILEVFQAGFTLNGKLIRPARVIVSKQMN
jgi:molecular chaperone GrpE